MTAYIYVSSVSGQRIVGNRQQIWHAPIIIRATSQDEAYGMAISKAEELYTAEDGWSCNASRPVLLDDMLKNVGAV